MTTYSNKVHSHGNVPFSWEKKPGVSKETTQTQLNTNLLDHDQDHDHDDDHDDQGFVLKLPSPPPVARISSAVPPPPGGSAAVDQQPLLRSSSTRGLRKQGHDHQDPFLAAFKVCTKSSSVKRGKSTHDYRSDNFMSGLRSFFAVAPCKGPGSCAVRDGNLVRVSHQL